MPTFRDIVRERLIGALRGFLRPQYLEGEEFTSRNRPVGDHFAIPDGFNGSEISKSESQSWAIRVAENVGTALGVLRKAMLGQPTHEPKGHYLDPESFYPNYGQFRERPSGLSFDTLRAMAYRTPAVSAIHQTRMNQTGHFGFPQTEPTEMGFIIVPRNREERKHPSQLTYRKIEELTEFFCLTGTRYGDRHIKRDRFDTAIRKMTRDSLVYDQYVVQPVPDAQGRPAEFFVMPGHSMRMAIRDDEDGSWHLDPDDIHYVQVERGEILEEFTARELVWGIRNPRSDVEVGGYGYSELEQLVTTVTGLLWAEQYNYRFFSSGSTIKGILNVKGFLTREQIRAFRREWFALLSGVHNAWRTPIMNAEEVQFVPMHASNKDMEFMEWIHYLIKVACGIYQIDPSEINFNFGNEGQSVQVFESSNEAKARLSRDRGLRPLVRKLQGSLNEIMERLDPNFEIQLAGLDAKSEEQKAQLFEQLTRSGFTINEARDQIYGMPEVLGGEMVRSGEWLQYMINVIETAVAGEPPETAGANGSSQPTNGAARNPAVQANE